MKEELTEKERHLEISLADLSERILREEVSEETEVSEAEDHADHSLKMEKEDLSQAVEDLQLEDAEDSTQQRRASLEETSTIYAMRTKAESTK